MMAVGANLLKESGKPLFFRVKDPAAVALSPPEPRLGTSIRTAVRSLTVMQKEALVISSRTGQMWRLASDEGPYLDGHDYAPCPLSFLSTGMVSSYMNEIEALAAQRGIAIKSLRLIQDNYYTMKGSALRGTMTGGAKDIGLEAQIDAEVDPAALQALVYDAVTASPLNGLMRSAKESLCTLTHNDRPIANAKALPVGGAALPEAGERFALAEMAEGEWSGLIQRTGQLTPQNENTATFAGGSLTETQDRMLHLRVFATKRADGVKEITQYLYNPHGTIFRFQSDEEGRAPDAESYICAGVGFCFMTQFGRYAKIAKKPLHDYRIIQDAHFSLAGASDKTGKEGTADPLETHCYLWSDQDDAFAQTALDMAEQTCFLHAFCKADLKAKVRVTAFDESFAA
ncbi:MAG: OsmC family protein [Cohaesibacteraceae bacterium]